MATSMLLPSARPIRKPSFLPSRVDLPQRVEPDSVIGGGAAAGQRPAVVSAL